MLFRFLGFSFSYDFKIINTIFLPIIFFTKSYYIPYKGPIQLFNKFYYYNYYNNNVYLDDDDTNICSDDNKYVLCTEDNAILSNWINRTLRSTDIYRLVDVR